MNIRRTLDPTTKKWVSHLIKDKYFPKPTAVKPVYPYENYALRRIERGEDYDKVYLDFLSSEVLAGVPSDEDFEEWVLPTLWDKRRLKYFVTLTFNRKLFLDDGNFIKLNKRRITQIMHEPIHTLKRDHHFIILPEVLMQQVGRDDSPLYEPMVHYHGIIWRRKNAARQKGPVLSLEEWNSEFKRTRGFTWLKPIQPKTHRKTLNYVTKYFNENGQYNDMPFYINHTEKALNKCCQECFDNMPTYDVERILTQSKLGFQEYKKDPTILDNEGSWIFTELGGDNDTIT